jgi:hypothetical protein
MILSGGIHVTSNFSYEAYGRMTLEILASQTEGQVLK